jgi:hypothetical protein
MSNDGSPAAQVEAGLRYIRQHYASKPFAPHWYGSCPHCTQETPPCWVCEPTEEDDARG